MTPAIVRKELNSGAGHEWMPRMSALYLVLYAALLSCRLVRAAFFAAALREVALRRFAADLAWFDNAFFDAAFFGIFFSAFSTARDRRDDVAFFFFE